MKFRLLVSGVAVALVLVVMFAAAAAARATSTEFTATAQLLSIQLGSGEVKCFDGTPTGAWPPCTSGRAHVRDLTVHAVQMSNDPRATGSRTLVWNLNLDASGQGPMWGTWRLETAAGGAFEGTFTGRLLGYTVGSEYRAIGHGQGALDGMKAMAEGTADALLNEKLSGVILDPRGN